MTNHYHLLIETPKPNLSKAMQYLNSMYVQQYNRSQKTDGSLFKGRFKAILVDEDSYLTALNKYIHRNPIEIKSKKKLVEKLENYEWSSYRYYLNKTKKPNWLNIETTINHLNIKNPADYQSFVEDGEIDEEIQKFYEKTNLLGILGDKVFKNKITKLISSRRDTYKSSPETNYKIKLNLSPNQIINAVAKFFEVSHESITQKTKSKKENTPRKLAIYLCQKDGRLNLKQIAKEFNLSEGSISYAINYMQKEINAKQVGKIINEIEQLY
jgi:REP element-mobilizing transposase RayT